MNSTVVIDANVLLYNPKALFDFPNSELILPIEVIEEIDTFKREMTELGRNSRTVGRLLDQLREYGRLGEGVSLENGGMLKIACKSDQEYQEKAPLDSNSPVDGRILDIALSLQKDENRDVVEVITKDVNLRIKADTLGIKTDDYELESVPDADQYTGWHEFRTQSRVVQTLREGKKATGLQVQGAPNEYMLAVDEEDATNKALGRIDGDEEGCIAPLTNTDQDVAGIHPLNIEQTFALAALLDENIRLVTLTGKAGTGKTLLAIAAGLQQVFGDDRYHRVLVFRPTMPVGRDIGYLPGDVQEKMRPWMQPVYDAIDLIREEDRRRKARLLPSDLLDCEELKIEPMTFIRGRSIPHQFIILDEAQNLSPLEVKTAVTRVGRNTKIIMTGDPHQIDNPYVESLSNGLTYLVERFKGSNLAAHVGLSKGERSILAETAANML